MDIIERFKRGEVSIVELMEQLGKSADREEGMPDRRKQDRPADEAPRRRSTDKPGTPGDGGLAAPSGNQARIHA